MTFRFSQSKKLSFEQVLMVLFERVDVDIYLSTVPVNLFAENLSGIMIFEHIKFL